ncbi:hypothetical protein Tco_0657455 [Tanacetum coccineum]|uniref:Reverse transcriptase Ty1/copia-type domain-containing protein n=1 Tax=Tanacetum coccineum TaxID=301880 RepID=A0ABQ4XCY3_9ASTR
MNYKPVVTGNQSNGNAGTKACADAGKARVEIVPGKYYILLPLWTQDPPFSSSPKDSPDAGLKPSREEEKKDAEDPGNEGGNLSEEGERINQEKDTSVNSTNNINTVSPTINTTSIEHNVIDENTVYGCVDDPNIPDLEEISIFSDAENDNSRADINNLDTYFQVSHVPTIRIHKDHPLNQFIRDLQSATQTRQMTKNLEEYGTQKGSSTTKGSKLDRGYAGRASTIQATRSLDFGRVSNRKRAIGTKWVFRNKKDERGFVIENKARLVAQGWMSRVLFFMKRLKRKSMFVNHQDLKKDRQNFIYQEGPSSMGELTIFLGLEVKQKEDRIFISQDKYVTEILKKFGFSDVKTASTPMETHKPLLKDSNGKDVDEHLHRSMIGSLMYLTSLRIFRYLKGQPKLGLWYPKDSPFDLVAFTDSDNVEASLDRKSTIGDCQFLRCRLISWQCKKQTVVANSTTEAEYIAASNCYGQVLWIQNQMLDYGYNFMHIKIYIDNESIICIVKNPIFHLKTKHIEIRHHFIRDSVSPNE